MYAALLLPQGIAPSVLRYPLPASVSDAIRHHNMATNGNHIILSLFRTSVVFAWLSSTLDNIFPGKN
jgi:hypothetical protein